MDGFSILYVLAQAQAPEGGQFNFLFFIAIIAFAFYLLILRPQTREKKEREQLLSGMSKGDKVVSAGGIHGTITNLSGKETVEVEVAKGTRLTFNRSSISIVNPKNKPETDKDKAEKSEEAKGGKKSK